MLPPMKVYSGRREGFFDDLRIAVEMSDEDSRNVVALLREELRDDEIEHER